MKYKIALFALLCLAGCGRTQGTSSPETSESRPKTTVTIVHGRPGHILKEKEYPATTAYLNKFTVTSPVPAYIVGTSVQPGSTVKAGQTLFSLVSREHHALGDDGTSIPVTASCDGIVMDVAQRTGNFVAEGTVLCTVADAGSLVFEISVPAEQTALVRQGSKCRIELPDGRSFPAVVHEPLAVMNAGSQSCLMIARANAGVLPEGLNAKAIFPDDRKASAGGIIVPKEAVQSDESLTEHWVMKMNADSTAERISVRIEGRNASEIEIVSDKLSPSDDIILAGAYGLEDGAAVTVSEKSGI